MTKRGKIRAAALALGLVAVLAGLWGRDHLMLADSTTRLEYAQKRSLNDLTDYVSGLAATLEKAPYVNTAALQSSVSAKLAEQSGGAKAALASLPLSGETADRLSRFLSQVGDYGLYLSRRSAAGLDADPASGDVLTTLRTYAEKLSNALQAAQTRVDTERLSLAQVRSALNNVEDLAALPSLDDDFDQAAKEFAQFPALLYDGPFSDHIPQREALGLQGQAEITLEEARQEAARFLQADPAELNDTGEGGSQLAVWTFATEDSQINVSKAGGKVIYYKRAGEVRAENLTPQQAVEKARETLEKLGITDCRETYFLRNDRMCTINFAAALDLEGQEVTGYPDLVKVVIELENGGAVEVDAVGWWMNHRERDLALPTLTEEEARDSVSPRLTARQAALAVIPTPGQDEVLCWEFLCTGETEEGPREFLVYINGETGMEEQLYLLQKDDHGTLAV